MKTWDHGFDRESITITVEKPRFYLQPGSIDSAILFWLNYKSTYEYWLQQRQQFSSFLVDNDGGNVPSNNTFNNADTTGTNKGQKPTNINENVKNINNFLALKLRVTGLGLALPLSNTIKKDIFKTNIDCLVISLNETSIYACSSGCIVSKGQFNNFCLRFAENFNLNSVDWSPFTEEPTGISNGKAIMNAWTIPSGSYEVCSSSIEKTGEKLDVNNVKKSPIWILSVKWKMEGIEVNLDTSIGKWMSKLADTVTRLAETQNNYEVY